jgi:SnoaL-like domain
MHQNHQIIQNFYTSFQQLDVNGMSKCYHTKIHFSDPVFPSLNGKEPSAMWAMLIENLNKNKGGWTCTASHITANDTEGACRWEAQYLFSATGRKVHNIIDASFKFEDGLIIQHVDSFDFYRWARMAFGFKGILLGWAPFFKTKVQTTVKGRLQKFLNRTQ